MFSHQKGPYSRNYIDYFLLVWKWIEYLLIAEEENAEDRKSYKLYWRNSYIFEIYEL